MNIGHRFCVAITATVALLGGGTVGASAESYSAYDIEIVLDASGSMNEAVAGQPKIDIARQAIKTLIEKIPAETRVGLRAYGHQSPRDAKNCKDSQLLVPIQKIQKDDFIAKVNAITPNGYTPIEFSLLEAKKDFEAKPEFKKMVILVSDGKETCEGDPCKAVKVLKESGFDFEVNVVGFAVDAETEKELRCIAESTGGAYKGASNAQELVEGLTTYAQRAKIEYKPIGGAVKPGSGFPDATEIGAGDYALDIFNNETHFFKIKLLQGQTLNIVANGRNKKPGKSVSLYCYTTFYLNIYDEMRMNTFSTSTTNLISSNPDPKSFVFRKNYTARSDETLYVTISAKMNMCEWLPPVMYEMGVFIKGGAAKVGAVTVVE